MKIFTHTQGRTGTAFLAELFRVNTDWEVHHEHMKPEDYGVKTPDIRILRCYNTYDPETVRDFWQEKLMKLPRNYVETSHVLSKAGLNHFVGQYLTDYKIIHLHRPCDEVIGSMIKRGDYVGHGGHWLWHLDQFYPNNKLRFSDDFAMFGPIGACAWYWAEMELRKPDNAVTISVKDLNNSLKASDFLKECGVILDSPKIPQRKNASYAGPIHPDVQSAVNQAAEIANKYVREFRDTIR